MPAAESPSGHGGRWYTFIALFVVIGIGLVVLLVLGLTGNLTSSSAKVSSTGPGGTTTAERQFCQNLQQVSRTTVNLRASLQTRRLASVNDARRSLNTAIRDLDPANLPVSQSDVSGLMTQVSILQRAVDRADQQNLSAASVAAAQAPLEQTLRQVQVVQQSATFCTSS